MKNLELYQKVTTEMVEKAVVETARETVQELKETSPVGPTGDYAKSWTYRRDPELRKQWKYSMVVCSKKPDYRLTHLLEYGHAIKNGTGRIGGKVKGRPHIRRAEDHAMERLEKKIKEAVKG